MPFRNLLDSTEWREWGQDGYTKASPNELTEFRYSLARPASENIAPDVEQWTRLLNTLSAIQGDVRQVLLRKLERMAEDLKWDANAETLRTAIRSELHRHRSHPDAWWAMPSSDVDTLHAIYDKLTPTDLVGAYAWLFSHHWPDLPGGKLGESQEQRQKIDAARGEAVLAVFE